MSDLSAHYHTSMQQGYGTIIGDYNTITQHFHFYAGIPSLYGLLYIVPNALDWLVTKALAFLPSPCQKEKPSQRHLPCVSFPYASIFHKVAE